jgi:gas vesicle protein
MKSFLAGFGIGIGLGLLFAPMSGEQTRGNIRDRANDLADSARETIEQGRERVRRGINSFCGSEQVATEASRPVSRTGTTL